MDRIYKTVDDSRVETVYLIRPTHLNGANRLFGGILMQWIDEAAGIVAKRHCGGNVTTASVDNLIPDVKEKLLPDLPGGVIRSGDLTGHRPRHEEGQSLLCGTAEMSGKRQWLY